MKSISLPSESPGASLATKDLAAKIQRATKRTDTPVSKAFVRAASPARPAPFYDLYARGRSGDVTVKLYLALLWKCVSPPYESRGDTARGWALLLGLDDPPGKGARKIRSALDRLEGANLIETYPNPGGANTIRLLAEDGSGAPYRPASEASYQQRLGDGSTNKNALYFKVSGEMWLGGYMQGLKGPALAMYMILACEQAYRKDVWFSTRVFAERYGISAQTRAVGTEQLTALGLLRVRPQPMDNRGLIASDKQLRTRNLYRLVGAAAPA